MIKVLMHKGTGELHVLDFECGLYWLEGANGYSLFYKRELDLSPFENLGEL